MLVTTRRALMRSHDRELGSPLRIRINHGDHQQRENG